MAELSGPPSEGVPGCLAGTALAAVLSPPEARGKGLKSPGKVHPFTRPSTPCDHWSKIALPVLTNLAP